MGGLRPSPISSLFAVAVALQFIQMRQMNSRNKAAAQANPQMQTMQKIMPIFFAYIYFIIPAAVVIYMIVSTMIRIATQDILFRTGIVQPVGSERAIPGKSKAIPASAKEVAPPKKSLSAATDAKDSPDDAVAEKAVGNGKSSNPKPTPGGKTGGGTGKGPTAAGSNGNGKGAASASDGTPAPQSQNRSKAKRTRKAR